MSSTGDKIALFILLYILTFVVITAAAALPVEWLWNAILPTLSSLRQIGYFDAWRIVGLVGLIILPVPLTNRLV